MRRFRGLENIINGSCPVASKITMPLLASITGLNVGHASGNAVAYSLKTIPLTDVVESRGALGEDRAYFRDATGRLGQLPTARTGAAPRDPFVEITIPY